MLYFLYMSTTISNTLFHHTLNNGIIEYVNKYPFVVKENFILESTINNNYTERQNITLLEAQKHILKYTKFIGDSMDIFRIVALSLGIIICVLTVYFALSGIGMV